MYRGTCTGNLKYQILDDLRMLTMQSGWTVAKALAALASKNSRDPAYESPYSKEAIQQVSLKQFVSISLLLIKN